LLSIGTVIGVVGALASLAVLALLPPHILAFFLPMLLVAFGNGMTQPSAIAGAISANPRLAGTASGLVGALQMGFGALMTVVVGLTEHGAGIATAATMAASGVGAMLALRAARGAEA
jgi:DHA1 family bicyclomycin/chloramphenicol resistance-like MFS transporter